MFFKNSWIYTSKLFIGIGVEKLIVPAGKPLCGYPNPDKRKNTGTETALFVEVLTLRFKDEITACLITSDIIGLDIYHSGKFRQRIHKEFKEVPKNNIIFACSHTHSAPMTVKIRDNYDKEFLAELEHKIVRAVKKSLNNFAEVKAGAGLARVDYSYNRRVIENGKCRNVWTDPEKKHAGQTDKDIGILRFDDLKGLPVAAIINYACHPVVMGQNNLLVSPDYPGYLREHMEKNIPGLAAFFITGAGADINPHICGGNDFKAAEEMGTGIAGEVLKQFDKIKTSVVDKTTFYREKVVFETRKDCVVEDFAERMKSNITSEIQIMTVNDTVFVFLPGEPMVEIGLKIKKIFGNKNVFISGYSNDYFGYLCNNSTIPFGGYEAGYSASHKAEQVILDCISARAGQLRSELNS